MPSSPIYAQWDGVSFEPLMRHHNALNAEMVVGEIYRLNIENERSMASHGHMFASLHDAWMNLPENIASQFVNEDHFRNRGLIETGWYLQRDIACQSRAEAERWMRELRSRDEYAVFSIAVNVIVERIAKSQSMRAMGKADFQKSKQDVTEWAWSLAGISPETARAMRPGHDTR